MRIVQHRHRHRLGDLACCKRERPARRGVVCPALAEQSFVTQATVTVAETARSSVTTNANAASGPSSTSVSATDRPGGP